jgi:hypothetical protein
VSASERLSLGSQASQVAKRSPMGSTDTLGRQIPSRIDTSVVTRAAPLSDDDYLEASPLRTSPSNPSGPGLPSFRLSTSPILDGPSSTYHPEPKPTNLRVRRNESRKLLSHVLHQLAHRKKPPPVKDMWIENNDTNTRGFGMVTGTLKDFVKRMPDKRVGIQNDLDDDESRGFSTDETLDLMIQLQDVFTMSIGHGWKIFDDGFAASLHHNCPLNQRLTEFKFKTAWTMQIRNFPQPFGIAFVLWESALALYHSHSLKTTSTFLNYSSSVCLF